MCGRYTLDETPEQLAARLGCAVPPAFPPRFNIAPATPVIIAREDAPDRPAGRELTLVRWGLLPSWVKDPKQFPLLLNARAETIAVKPAFRAAIRHHRCIIPATGWYEWQAAGKVAKRPHYITAKDGVGLAFAGVWEHWLGADGSEIETAAIITVDANADVGGIHDRMPALLSPADFALWLSPRSDLKQVMALLRPAPEGQLTGVPVGTRVNSAREEGESLTMPLSEPAPARKEPAPPAQGSLF